MTKEKTVKKGRKLSAKAKQNVLAAFAKSRDGHWEEMYKDLQAYKRRYGHCNVPHARKKNNMTNIRLGIWVIHQRYSYKNNVILPARIVKLQTIGFEFEPKKDDAVWNEKYQKLVAYKAKHGNCKVPKSWSLGMWVKTQRVMSSFGTLDDAKAEKLDVIDNGFKYKKDQQTVARESDDDDDATGSEDEQGGEATSINNSAGELGEEAAGDADDGKLSDGEEHAPNNTTATSDAAEAEFDAEEDVDDDLSDSEMSVSDAESDYDGDKAEADDGVGMDLAESRYEDDDDNGVAMAFEEDRYQEVQDSDELRVTAEEEDESLASGSAAASREVLALRAEVLHWRSLAEDYLFQMLQERDRAEDARVYEDRERVRADRLERETSEARARADRLERDFAERLERETLEARASADYLEIEASEAHGRADWYESKFQRELQRGKWMWEQCHEEVLQSFRQERHEVHDQLATSEGETKLLAKQLYSATQRAESLEMECGDYEKSWNEECVLATQRYIYELRRLAEVNQVEESTEAPGTEQGSVIQTLKQEKQQLLGECNLKGAHIDYLDAELEAMSKQNDEITETLLGRNDEISRLSAALAANNQAKAEQEYDLMETLRARDDEIARLSAALAANDQAKAEQEDDLVETLEARDDEIARLSAALAAKDAQLRVCRRRIKP